MDIPATDTSSSVASQTSVAQSSPTQAPETSSNSPEGDSSSASPTSAPSYTPNFKFKVMDQEKEFDEWVRPVIKDAETEKKLRELYEKAHGLDYVKSGRQKLQSDFDSLRTEHGGLRKYVETASGYLKGNNIRGFIEHLKIPKQQIFQYVLDEIKYDEMPAEQKQIIEKQRQDEVRARQLEEENNGWKQRYEEVSVKQLETELSYTLERPEVSHIAKQFDERFGPGAFRSQVIKEGQWYYSVKGELLPPEQAVQNVMRVIALQSPAQPAGMPMGAAQPAAPQPAGAVAPDSVPQDKKPIIPNIQGRGTSPAKKVVNSVKALKELARQKSA
jgi:hypothetical protein